MPLTLTEIVEHEERLRREIVERECLLAAFKVLHGYAASGENSHTLELGLLASALKPATSQTQLPQPPAAASPEPAALPAPLPVKPYVNPEIVALQSRLHGYDSRLVRWAIARMTDDYTLRDIAAELEREGTSMAPAGISVVLTRMKSRGEIEEIKRGAGPIPALFRKPESAIPPKATSNDSVSNAETTTASAAAV
jgi:hypothetical protein